MLRTLIALSILLSAPALADRETQPVHKRGPCPAGYYTSGPYCLPGKNAKDVIVKAGFCPAGWYTSGAYCIRRK